MLERYKTHRGIARVYSIVLYRDLELNDSRAKFKLIASTGFVIKLAGTKYLVSCLNSIQSPELQKNFELKEAKTLTVASFGNRDLLPLLYKHLKETKTLSSKSLKAYLLEKYYKVLTKVKPNRIGLEARKEWLISNSRHSEVLDSEFYYQMLPSLDMAVFDIDQQFLKSRQIKALDTMRQDSRYVNFASIGFSIPHSGIDFRDYRLKYGQSQGISKNENLMTSLHKCASLGRVKSYGSITTVVNSVGVGAQGSPCFSELGKCWGFIISSHNDVPDKYRIEEELELIKQIDLKLKEDDEKKKGSKKSSKTPKDLDFSEVEISKFN